MTTHVIRTGNPTVYFARMGQLGFPVKPEFDEEGERRSNSQRLGLPSTMSMTQIVGGDYVFEVRLTTEEELLLPHNDTPNFTVCWSSSDVDAEDQPIPKPLFDVEVPVYDEQGNQTGTQIVQQTAPELA